MLQSEHSAFSVRAKTGEVVGYHHDEDQPGKPLYLLVPSGLLALVALLLMFWIAYATWYQGSLPRTSGLSYLLVLTPVYSGSVFLFSYAYELYNTAKAIRLTAFLVFFSAAALIIAGVLFALLSKNESSSSSSSNDTSSSSWGSRTSLGWGGGSWGSIDMNSGGFGGAARESVPVASAPPEPVVCSYCHTSYVPAQAGSLVCPHCGAAQPQAAKTA
jgi:uncharacterized membrane protein YgcG